MSRSKISVFWDLATCPISGNYASLPEALKDVRQFTTNFGIVTNMKAYWDKKKIRSTDHPIIAIMLSMGVNLVDCSSMQGYTPDALSKMLSIDIVMSAMDNPIGAGNPEDDIIMIMSGDKSILYPISLLMFRGHTVFLAVPDDDQDVQPFQATRVFSWYRDVLGSGPSPKPVTPSVAPNLRSPGWIVNGTHIPQLSLEGTPSIAASSSNGISPPSRASVHKFPSRSTTTFPSPAMESSRKSGSFPPSEPQDTRAPSALSLRSNSRTTASNSPMNLFAGHAIDKSTNGDVDPPKALESQAGAQARENHDDADDEIADDWAAAGNAWGAAGGWEVSGSSWLIEPSPAVKSKPTTGTTGTRITETKDKPQNQPKRGQNSGPTKETTATKGDATAPLPNPPLSVFNPLLEVLRGAENQAMRRSQVGEHLAKHKGLYQSAGVNSFGEFIAIAIKKNLVTLCGVDNFQQVKLKKRR